MSTLGKTILILLVLAGLGVLGWKIRERLREDSAPAAARGGPKAAPVEVAAVRRGPMELRRVFTGTLEAPAELVVSPKISGRIEEITLDLGDPVRRGQVVARLDDDEHLQAVAQAEADIAVARAHLAEAESALEIAVRALERVETLRERGVASESQYDVVKADHLSKLAASDVAAARVRRAEASLETDRIRLGYTVIEARWTGGADVRIVAERFVDEGLTVSASEPILSIVELDPITGVIYVAERDYARLSRGQQATLLADAYPGEAFPARIDRIAPGFRTATRQARVELTIGNQDHRLKPGMFVRATVVLSRVEDARMVPEEALTRRDDVLGVFAVGPDGAHAAWRPVTVGIRSAGFVQILDGEVSGRVVTLGQQLLDDGSAIVIPGDREEPRGGAE